MNKMLSVLDLPSIFSFTYSRRDTTRGASLVRSKILGSGLGSDRPSDVDQEMVYLEA